MADSAPARHIEKMASADRDASPGRRSSSRTTSGLFRVVTWPDVVGALARESTRGLVLAQYKASGFTPDDFAHKRPAREELADALTRAEDRIETSSSSASREREALRDVRRRLERELWP
jgi:hypothetical protein